MSGEPLDVSEVLLLFQTDPSDARSRIICEPINGAEAVAIFENNFYKESWSAFEFFHCKLPLFSM